MKKGIKRLIFWGILMAIAFAFCVTAVSAANFPTRPMDIAVGFAAGGANHMAAENLRIGAQEVFGMPLTVTPRPGAASAIANSFVAMQPSDGYNLLNGTLSLQISMFTGDVDYTVDDFIAVFMYSEVVPCLAIRANLPIYTLQDLVDWVKANPGTFAWGHSGVASTLHLAGCLMFDTLGIIDSILEVPFTGTPEAITQVVGGHLDAVISFPASIQEQVRAGNLRVLGTTSDVAPAEFPDALTFREQGFDAVLTSTRGIFVRSDTPKEIIDILEDGFAKIVQSEEFREAAIALGEPPIFLNSADATALYMEQYETIGILVEMLGLAH